METEGTRREKLRGGRKSLKNLLMLVRRWNLVMVFGCLYLAAIPLFAVVYTTMPRGFFHATARYEGESQEVRVRAASEILKWFGQRATAGELSPERKGESWRVDHIEDLRPDPESRVPNFRCSLAVSRGRVVRRDGPDSFVGTVSLTAAPFDYTCENRLFRCRVAIYIGKIANSPNNAFPTYIDVSAIREALSCMDIPTDDFSRCVIEMPDSVVEAVTRLDDVEAGFPAESGSFKRMFYLSAVIATTVGFGDIVPLTDDARMAVSLEAVVEVILAGLFLSALAKRASGR